MNDWTVRTTSNDKRNSDEKLCQQTQNLVKEKTRPDTRLTQSRAGGQGPYLRSLDHMGRSSEVKDCKNPKKVKCDGRTDGPTDGPTKRVVESRSTRLKILLYKCCPKF